MFVVTENGFPHVTDRLKPFRPNRLAVMAKAWSESKAYDEKSRWRPQPIELPSFNRFQKFLAHTFYNPKTDIEIPWEADGESTLSEIVSDVERGLEKDDDIIQQWFGADDVLKLLRSATTFEEMCDRVECVCGGFEADDRLRNIVVGQLGNEWAEQDEDPKPDNAPS